MTAGAEVVCNDVVRKVETEEKCVAGLNTCDLNEVGDGDVATVDDNVGGNSNGFVAGNGKDDTDDSSYVFVGGRVEVSAGDPDDAGSVNEDDFVPIAGSADEADQLKKEGFGTENGGISGDLLTLETKGTDNGSTIVSDSEVKAVTDDVLLENGSNVDPSVVLEANASAQEVNGHLEKNSGEDVVVKSTEEVDNAEEIPDLETQVDDISSGVTFDPELALNTTDTSQVETTESESTIHPSDLTFSKSPPTTDVIKTTDESFTSPHTVSNTDCEAMVNGEPECISNPIDIVECQVTVDGSGKPSEDLEGGVIADGSESFGSPTKEQDRQVTVDESSKPSEDLECEVTAVGSESSGSPTKERDGQVTVDESSKPSVTAVGSESSGSPTEERDGQVTVDESSKPFVTAVGSESSGTPTEEQDGQVTVDESSKLSEDLECEVTAVVSESSGSPTEEQDGQVTVDESSKPFVTAVGSESSGTPTEEQDGQVTVDESSKRKPSEDLVSQVTTDEPESLRSLIKEQECEVSVDVSDSTGSLVVNQECPVSVESETSGNPTEEVDGKSGDHQELLVITSDVNGVKAEHQSVSVSVPYQSVDIKTEGTDIGLSIESEENSNSGLVLSENTEALANGQAEKFDGILETGEAQISATEADRSVLLISNTMMESSEEKLEKQMDGSSETVTESVETGANFEDIKGQVEIVESVERGENVEDIKEQVEIEESVETGANFEDIKEHVEIEESVERGANFEDIKEQVEIDESVETGANPEDMKEQVEMEDEVRESQTVATNNVQDDVKSEDNTTEFANEAEVPLETETNSDPGIHVSTVSQYEVSNSIDKPQEVFQPEKSSENVETLKSECDNSDLLVAKDHDSVSNPDELVVTEQKDEIVANADVSNDDEKEAEIKDAPVEYVPRATEDMDRETGVENVDVPDDEEKETEDKDVPVQHVPRATEDMDCETGVKNVDDEEKETEVKDVPVEYVPRATEDMDCETAVKDVNVPDDEDKETEVKDSPVAGHPTLSFSDTIVNCGAVIEFGSFGRQEPTHNKQNQEVEDIDGIQSDEIPTSSVESSVIDATDVQNEAAEVLPYNFLIKIPRYEDENFRDQIRSAQLLVEEKTRLRDAIRVQIQDKRAKLKAHNEAYNAAKTEETAARRLVRLKRQEIDSVQVIINRWKNAMSIEDINGRISNMEHMIQHETMPLKDEKQYIREIKQLTTLREQLASNMGTPEEIRQAIDEKDHNEERMKTLRKELDSLKDKAAKAEAAVKAIGKTYDEESRRERELQSQFRAADDVRQNVYARLNSLKKLSYEKNKNFRQFKEDLMAARDFASHGNKDALHRLCANQVETFMEQWNTNDEFRKDYTSRCNINASRRQRGFEGGPLLPDDVVPTLHADMDEKADNGPVPIPGNVKSVSVVSIPVEDKNNNRSIENVAGQKNQLVKPKGVGKLTVLGSADVTKDAELVVDGKTEEENSPTKEEIELARKAEELRKEEIAAKLKEQRRLEEKAKAIEALERKKRNAEKSQMRAELRARKEAEQREKEREKRLRKKEKKKTGSRDGSVNGDEPAASSESSNEAITKDPEPVSKETNKRKTQALPPHLTKQQRRQVKPKPIPPPLVNRNRKRWQQWGKVAAAIAGVFLLFMLGNTNYFRQMFSGFI